MPKLRLHGPPVRAGRLTRTLRRRPWHIWLQTVAAVATVVAGVILPAAMVANAASSTIYLGTNTSNNIGQNATDPHGGIWLKGTTDGTTAGPMDTSLVPPAAGSLSGQGTTGSAWSFGHEWETDVPSGFCRVDTVLDANSTTTPQGTIQLYARPNAYTGAPASGGCITAGQKASQPVLDPRRNPDGTFFVYTCDWAVFSQGCYRMTYDPGTQTMKAADLLAPGRFPTAGGRGVKPFSTDLGADGNLYVTTDLVPYIYRITSPNDPNIGNQTVSIVSTSNDNSRIRASTFACWDPLRGAATGLPTCAQSAAAGNPAPDLVLTQKTKVTVMMDVANCVGVPVDVNGTGGPSGVLPGCAPVDTDIRVLTPMGAYTQGIWNQVVQANGKPGWGPALDPNTIYITDSPGATSQIIRYTINKDTQDSYSNFGVFPDGTTAEYSFGFSPNQSPDSRMFLGDDPSAGASSGNGHIWTVAANAPADVLGAPGAPATPPPPPSQKVGAIYGSGVSLPNDGVWLPGALGGHMWIADGAAGFCRMDAAPAGSAAPFALNAATCDITTTKPGQPVYDPNAQPDGTHFVYLPDQSTKGLGVVRVNFNPTTEAIVAGSGVAVAPGQGLENQKTSGAALNPTSGTLYVGFLNRNTTAPTEIARIHNPGGANPTVDFVANVTRHKPIFTLDFIGQDLYVGNNGGLDILSNADSCAPGACISIQVLNTRGPRGMASDGVDKIYMAGPSIPAGCPPTCPAPGTLTTPVDVYSVSTGDFSAFSSQGLLSDGTTLSAYDVVDSITLDPAGNVYVADDPNVLGLPAGQGRVFKVAAVSQEPLPALVSKPNSLTNQNKPLFAFQSSDTSASFKCSLVPLGAADSFVNCGGTGNGTVTYGTDAAGNIVQNGANGLVDGPYVFRVEGTGANGTSAPNSYGFRVDTVVPVVTISSQPVSPSNVNTPTFAFGADKAGVSFSCALTLAGGTPQLNLCTSPKTYGVTPDGSYTFTAQATDPAGNVGVATASLVIDTAAPTVTASPAGGVFTTAQTVTLTASTAATIYYTTDGTTPTTTSTNGASPVTVSIPGSATLKYFAKDAAGNVGPVASDVYQIGAVTISQNPPALSNDNTPTFAFTDTVAGTAFECSLVLQSAVDSLTSCVSPITYSAPQPDGDYRFVVKDAAGATAQFLFTIDTTPPVVTITNNPANPDTSSTATFKWVANETVTGYQCSFGLQSAADAFAACTSPATESNLTDGAYVFKIKGTDLAGNTSTPIAYLFNVSAVAPPTITSAPAQTLTGLINATAGTSATTTSPGPITAVAPTSSAAGGSVPVTIAWAGTACQSGVTNCNVDHYVLQESINGGAFSTLTLASPTATSIVRNLKVSPINNSTPATRYAYQVQAVDKAGNVSPFKSAPAFIVPDTDNNTSTSFNGSWSGVNLSGAFGGQVSRSSTPSATANPANAAPATSLAFVSTLGPDKGKAQIKIDGQLVATVDLYAPTQQTAQIVWAINGLAPGVSHNIQVVSTGTKNISSTAANVDYDAILALK
jgi:chitobiase/beta-hexosaminidase-like protein